MKPLDMTVSRVDYVPYFAYTECGGNIDMAEKKLKDIELQLYAQFADEAIKLYKVNSEDYMKFKGGA